MAKMARGGFLHATVEEMQDLIKKPRIEVWEKKKQGVEFPRHEKVKAAIVRHPAILRQNQTDGCLLCPNCNAKNPQTPWRWTGTGASPLQGCRQTTTELMPSLPETPPLPGTPPAPPSNNAEAQRSQIVNVKAGYAYLHTALCCAESFTLDASAQDSQNDTDFDPAMLNDEGTATG